MVEIAGKGLPEEKWIPTFNAGNIAFPISKFTL
jgi:hypothetical protein